MAILDGKLEFSDAQSMILSSAASVISTNVTNLGASEVNCWGDSLGPDIGRGGELWWSVFVETAFVGDGGTITAYLYTHTAATSIHTGTLLAQLAITVAEGVAGWKEAIKVPPAAMLQYIGVYYTCSGAAVTAGTVNSWIGLDYELID